jgi:hypothetical protein
MPPANFRSVIPVAVLVGLTGCASSGSPGPRPAPWVAGTYEFQSVIHGERITGVIEVVDGGPTAVTTSLSPCMPRVSEVWQPWHRSRTFDCAGDHRVEVSVGTQAGPPVTGWMRNTTMVTREEVISRTCVAYTITEAGTQVCNEWREQTQTVTRPVVESARILLVATAPAPNP